MVLKEITANPMGSWSRGRVPLPQDFERYHMAAFHTTIRIVTLLT